MSIRTRAAALTAAALLAVPAVATARPAEEVDALAPATATPTAAQPTAARPAPAAEPARNGAGDGAGTLTVLVLAGGALLAGAAGGFGGGRVLTQRHALRS